MEESGQLHVLTALAKGKEDLVPYGQEAGWTPELVWTWWQSAPEKN